MNTTANLMRTQAFPSAEAPVRAPRRLPLGAGLSLGALVSVGLWAGLAQIVIAVAG